MRPVVIQESFEPASCPSAERSILTGPTGQASPDVATETVTTLRGLPPSFSRGRNGHNRAVALNRRRMARDDFLGRALSLAITTFAAKAGGDAQAPTRKGGRSTLDRCLVQLAFGLTLVRERVTATPGRRRAPQRQRQGGYSAPWHDAERRPAGRVNRFQREKTENSVSVRVTRY